MEMKKNDRFVLKIEDMGENGEGIGRLDGYIWFVKDAVIGDVIEAGVTKMKKQYGFARLIRVIEPSEYRTEERCPSARRCGGCQIQAVDYQEQLRLKEKKVYNNLKRIGGLSSLLLPSGEETTEQTKEETERNAVVMEPIIGMENPWRYRNKAQFPFGRNKDGRIVTGFYAGRTHDIVEQEDCLLGVEENREILSIIRNFMEEYKIEPYNEETHRGLVRHVLIRKGFQTGELMVCLVINGRKLPGQQALTEHLLEIPGMTSISLNVNQEKTNVILGKELINLWGEGHITDYIGAVQYRISPLSFYQVNPVQTERLYGTALEYAGLTGNETVWDLYCGIGTIGITASGRAKRVIGVELNKDAVRDAVQNAKRNEIKNIEFYCNDAGRFMSRMAAQGEKLDVVFMDPPRSGSTEEFIHSVAEAGPRKVVYISCGPETLARDLKIFARNGYRAREAWGVDLFPWTGHVETVCLLSKLNTKQHIEVEVKMDELDITAAESKATYDEIKAYVLQKHGLKVSSLYIAQIKQKCGIIERVNYNKPKAKDTRQPQCPLEKEIAIIDALKYFQMI